MITLRPAYAYSHFGTEIDLPVVTDELQKRLDAMYDRGRLSELVNPYSFLSTVAPDFPHPQDTDWQRPKLGSYYHPLVGLAHYGFGCFLIDEYTWGQIKNGYEGSAHPELGDTFTLCFYDDPDDPDEVPRTLPNLSLLLVRPLVKTTTDAETTEEDVEQDAYVAVFVDYRYRTLHTTANSFGYGSGFTTWTGLLGFAGSIADAVDVDYLAPSPVRWSPDRLTGRSFSWLMDIAAMSVGSRIVQTRTDIAPEVQRPTTGRSDILATAHQDAVDDGRHIGGGPVGSEHSYSSPAGVYVYFGAPDEPTPSSIFVTTPTPNAAGETPLYTLGVAARVGHWADARADDTSTHRSNLAAQWQDDWEAWQHNLYDTLYAGFVAIPASGFCWAVEYFHSAGEGFTRFHKPPHWYGHLLAAQSQKLATTQWKQPVRVANINTPTTIGTDYAAGSTHDGVVLATGDRILIQNPCVAGETGVYLVNATGAPTLLERSAGMVVTVLDGDASAGTVWLCLKDGVTFVEIAQDSPWRRTVDCVASGNIVLATGLIPTVVIDGFTLIQGSRVLCANQTVQTENGVYIVQAAGAAQRDPENRLLSDRDGVMVAVRSGTVYAGTMWLGATLGLGYTTWSIVPVTKAGTLKGVNTSIPAWTSNGGHLESSTAAYNSAAKSIDFYPAVSDATIAGGLWGVRVSSAVGGTGSVYINAASGARGAISADSHYFSQNVTVTQGGIISAYYNALGDAVSGGVATSGLQITNLNALDATVLLIGSGATGSHVIIDGHLGATGASGAGTFFGGICTTMGDPVTSVGGGGPVTIGGTPTAPIITLDGDLVSIAALNSTGILCCIGVNTWAERILTGATNQVSIANSDGVAGNPLISLSGPYTPSAYTPYSVLCGGTSASTSLQSVATVGTSGQFLKSNGAGALPSWATVSGSGTVTSIDITPPAAGITATGGPVTVSGSITLALADDLAALEALAGTNTIYYRSGSSVWSAVTIGSGLSFVAGTLSATGGGSVTITGSGSIANSGTTSLSSFTGSGTSSGTNTGDQTTVSGNAGTATALQTARNINGVAFDGTANITIGVDGGTY